MNFATIALMRHPKVDTEQLGEMTLRSFGILANRGREPEDHIIISFILVESLAQVRGVPEITIVIECGSHPIHERKDGALRFSSISEMQSLVVGVLQRRFPVREKHPELKLSHGDGDDGQAYEAREVQPNSRLLGSEFQNEGDNPPCPVCGRATVKNGACYKCLNCGETVV